MKIIFMAILGLYLLLTPVLYRKQKPFWPWLTLGLSGVAVLLNQTFGYILDNYQSSFSDSQIDWLHKSEGTCLGLFFGMFITLCLCGFIRFRKKKQSQPGNREVRENPAEN